MGVMEEMKGRVKEAAGDLTGDDALKTEGSAQADKGAEETKESAARAEAQAHEKKAEMLDEKQKLAENS
jgi:uncharacterized protein YjbJ (UPF0337 family)